MGKLRIKKEAILGRQISGKGKKEMGGPGA